MLETSLIEDWHAHVYFDAKSREEAWALREAIEARFEMAMGRFHEKEVGPHPRWSYQIHFGTDVFDQLVPWLALNRGGLVVFIHPNSDDPLSDHRDRAIWLGAKLELKLEIFN